MRSTSPTSARRLRIRRLAYLGGAIAGLLALALGSGGDLERAASPGPLSGAHAMLEGECRRCHTLVMPELRAVLGTEPRRVMNGACLDCHAASMGYDRIELHAAHSAERVMVGDDDCADCHLEHEGRAPLVDLAHERCIRCHATEETPIARFAGSGGGGGVGVHPDFAPKPGSDAATLRFDHRLHLAIGRTTCTQCHAAPDARDPRARTAVMAPARFDTACHGCHPLTVEVAGQRLDVAHGEDAVAQDSLRLEARRLGLQGADVEAALASMFTREGTCGYCHEVESAGPAGPRVAAPNVRRRWYPEARFDHRQHTAIGYRLGDTKPETECRHCHAGVLTSTRAADVSVPGIATCRDCHGNGASDRCSTCHAFHTPPRGPVDYDAATPEQIESGRLETRFGMRRATPMWPIRGFFELPAKVWKRPDIEPRSPEFYAEVFRRYGLFEADFDNGGLPLGVVKTDEDFEGEPGMAVTCEFCHSSSLFGEVIRGQPNRFSTMREWFHDLNAMTTQRKDPLYSLGPENNPAVNAADQLGLIGLVIRQPDLSLDVPLALAVSNGEAMHLKPEFDALAFVKTPPWYTYRTKAEGAADYYFDGGYPKDGNFSAFTYVAAFLDPDGAALREALSAWQVGGHEYLASLDDRAPKYPFDIDAPAAARGRRLYDDHCSKCHGRYVGEAAPENLVYPGLLVGLDEIGTDPLRAHFPAEFAARTRKILRDDFYPAAGYVAPPLTSIWARAPYLHNGAVPTVRSLLERADRRPTRWAMLAHPNDERDYLRDDLGWRYRELQPGEVIEHNRVHDPDVVDGLLNGGHEYGVELSTADKDDLIAFLRTL